MSSNLPQIILQKIVHDENYCRRVLPFIKPEYFEGSYRSVYKLVLNFIAKYNKLPSAPELDVELDGAELGEDLYPHAAKIIESFSENPQINDTWLMENTEKWCKDRAILLAIVQAGEIIEGRKKGATVGAIPDLLQKALSINFDNSVGHDYYEDADDRFDFYHRIEEHIPFDLEMFNKITKGGLAKKTLNIILAGCVHPSTPVRIRVRRPLSPSKNISI